MMFFEIEKIIIWWPQTLACVIIAITWLLQSKRSFFSSIFFINTIKKLTVLLKTGGIRYASRKNIKFKE